MEYSISKNKTPISEELAGSGVETAHAACGPAVVLVERLAPSTVALGRLASVSVEEKTGGDPAWAPSQSAKESHRPGTAVESQGRGLSADGETGPAWATPSTGKTAAASSLISKGRRVCPPDPPMDEEERSLGKNPASSAIDREHFAVPMGGDVAGRPVRSRRNSVASERGSVKRPASSDRKEAMEVEVRLEEDDAGDWSETSTASHKGVKRKKKGRPPTTGEYIGYAEAKRAANEAEKAELELLRYRQRLEDGPGREAASIPLPKPEDLMEDYRKQPTADLAITLRAQMLAIRKVATISNKMKGTCVRDLRVAAIQAEVAGEELLQRTLTAGPPAQLEDENRQLKARLQKMEKEMAEMRQQIEVLRQKTSISVPDAPIKPPMKYERAVKTNARRRIVSSSEDEDRPPTLSPPPPPSGEAGRDKTGGINMQALMQQIGCMVEGKLKEFKRELVSPQPVPVMKKPSYAAVTTGPTGKGVVKPAKPEWKAKTVPPPEEKWIVVQNRKGAGKARGAPPPTQKKTAPVQKIAPKTKDAGKKPATQRQEGKPPSQKGKKSAIPARPPRTAAVTMTATPGGMSYADAMKKARASINIGDLGIHALKPKRGVTGALILEVPGKEGRQKAAILAARMEAVLKGTGVRVAQPVKRAELRISGLDDSVTNKEVAMAVAVDGDCGVGEVQVGTIRRAPSGLGTVWVRCTQAAARKLALAGKVTVGLIL